MALTRHVLLLGKLPTYKYSLSMQNRLDNVRIWKFLLSYFGERNIKKPRHVKIRMLSHGLKYKGYNWNLDISLVR